MNIVVLDGHTLNPGDLSWERMEKLGDLTVHERTPPEDVVPRAGNAEIVLTNKTVLDKDTITQLSKLQYIGVLATGYNVVDVNAASERDLPVTNVPTYGTHSVAQMAFALLLELTNRVGHHAQTVRDGKWSLSKDFCYWDYPLVELYSLTLGVVGYGRIGQATADIARAFGMKLLVHSVPAPDGLPENTRLCDIDELFSLSDAVTLHCPLTPETQNIVNAERLKRMKPTAFLVNTSRGPLIDEAALATALNEGQIAGAAVDVLQEEPAVPDNPLLKAKNCIVTPHISWASGAARSRLMDVATSNIEAFLAGKKQNVVNL